jgi:hypothetical protein
MTVFGPIADFPLHDLSARKADYLLAARHGSFDANKQWNDNESRHG